MANENGPEAKIENYHPRECVPIETLEPKYPASFDQMILESIPTSNLDVRYLIPTQWWIFPKWLARLERQPSQEPIIVIRLGEKFYIKNGHHRVVRALLEGRYLIRARVINPTGRINVPG